MFYSSPKKQLLILCVFKVLWLNADCVDRDICTTSPIIPKGSTRKCAVYPDLLQWGTGNSFCTAVYPYTDCILYVGMNLEIECQMQNSLILKNNQTISLQRTFRINHVDVSISGEYECRTALNNGSVMSKYFNVSVSTEPVIGLRDFYCNILTAFNQTHDCCSFSKNWRINYNGNYSLLSLTAFNFQKITVEQEWLTPMEEHYHTDLGLTIQNSNLSTGTFEVHVTKKPESLSSNSLFVACIITAFGLNNNSFSIYTILQIVDDTNIQKVRVNTSLPAEVQASEGETAMFECLYLSQYTKDNCIGTHIINYTIIDNKNETASNSTYFARSCNLKEDYSISWSDLYSLNVTIETTEFSKTFLYRFYILNVTMQNNNSILSCALKTKGQIQWMNSAKLLVYPKAAVTERSVDFVETTLFLVTVSIGGVVIILAIAVISIFILIYTVWRRNKEWSNATESEKAALTSDDSDSSDSEESLIPHSTSLQVYNYEGPQRTSLNVMQSSIGNDCSKVEGTEHSMKESHGFAELHFDNPSSCDSSAHYNNCVYISYTENKAEWVYDYLKPLIESWNSQVILHEDDMIPGYTVSGERQCLILQARRVVLVVSADYSSSPWCLYELQHAITKEPVLFKGRIIPVMIDGYHTLPDFLKGIMPLHDSDNNFENKLKMNICGTTL